jgi:undecaprenyl-phosphate 4-deoxy-4-formamido-L-arabinose transferase
MLDYSIIIPTYRGEQTIEILFQQINAEMEKMNYSYEVIFVFDNGKIDCWNKIVVLKSTYPNLIKGVFLQKNYGQHCATIKGFEIANANFIFTMDEDLQHSSADFKKLIDKQKENNCDVVYGALQNIHRNFFRKLGSNIFNLLLGFLIENFNSNYSAFRLIKKEIADKIATKNNSKIFLDACIARNTNKIEIVDIAQLQDATKKTSYTLCKLLQHGFNIIFWNSKLSFFTKNKIELIVVKEII